MEKSEQLPLGSSRHESSVSVLKVVSSRVIIRLAQVHLKGSLGRAEYAQMGRRISWGKHL
jgi:hypothetical protein